MMVRDLMEITDVVDALNKVLEYARGGTVEAFSEATERATDELGLEVALGLVQKVPMGMEEVLSIVEDNNVAYIKPPLGNEELFLELIAGTHGVFVDGEHLFREKDVLDRRYYNALSVKPINLGTLTDLYNLVNDAKSERITPPSSRRLATSPRRGTGPPCSGSPLSGDGTSLGFHRQAERADKNSRRSG